MRSLQEILTETNDNLRRKILGEAKLNATAASPTGAGHIEKYVDPYLPKGPRHAPDTHELEREHEGLPKGTRLTIKRKEIDKNGVTHIHAIPSGSTRTVKIPLSSVRKPSDKDGKHNEEHAVKKVWNHFSRMSSKDKRKHDLDSTLAEIDKAENDKTGKHPLHIKNAEDHEFAGKISGNDKKVGTKESHERARKSYYQNLRDAAHTVHAMRNHPDFSDHYKDGDSMEHSGKAKPRLSKHYLSKGVTGAGATSKGDALIIRSKKGTKGVKAISFKKTGNSQLMSGSPAEFHAIYSYAMKKGKIDTPENEKHLEKVRKHMDAGNHAEANTIVQKLHDKHPDLIHHVVREALKGEGKFASEDGRATHIAEIGKDAKVMTTEAFLKAHKEPISRLRPRLRKSKHLGGTKTTGSLETPKLPKRPKKVAEKLKTVIKKRMKKA